MGSCGSTVSDPPQTGSPLPLAAAHTAAAGGAHGDGADDGQRGHKPDTKPQTHQMTPTIVKPNSPTQPVTLTCPPATDTATDTGGGQPTNTDTDANNKSDVDLIEIDLLLADRSLPNDVSRLQGLVSTLRIALSRRDSTLRSTEKELAQREKELQLEKTQRAQSASGVLNQAMKIIRPSTASGGISVKRDSLSASIPNPPHERNSLPLPSSDLATTTGTIAVAQRDRTDSDTYSSSTRTTPNGSPTLHPYSASLLPLQSLPPVGESSEGVFDVDSTDTLRRELMDVLLAFAETELIVPNAQRRGGPGGTSWTMDPNSFSEVINSSSLDTITKQWLTAEFTRDQPDMGAATRQRHVSFIHTNRHALRGNSMSFSSNSNSGVGHSSTASIDSMIGSSPFPSTRLLLNPDLISLSDIETWDFDATSYSSEVLVLHAFKMFESFDLLKRFQIEPSKLTNFVMELDRNYEARNPYHNFMHGMDVLHCCWMYLRCSSVVSQARLRSIDLFAFFISAVAHDLAHPGTNNTFQVTTNSELAMIYNDVSVLENYHVSSCFRVMGMSDCNILSNLTRSEWLDVRKTIVSCILATDMSHHFEMVGRLDPLLDKLERIYDENRRMNISSNTNRILSPTMAMNTRRIEVEEKMDSNTINNASSSSSSTATATTASPLTQPPSPPSSPSVELSRDETLQLLNVLLHSADISNPAKPWKIAKIWGDRIQIENFAQGDLEKKLNLPVSPFMDRTQENQPQTSMNFIDFIVAPLVAAIVRAIPALVPLAENMIKNRKIWHQSLLDRLDASIPHLTGPTLVQKELERKNLLTKAQVFKKSIVGPIRKIAETTAKMRAGSGGGGVGGGEITKVGGSNTNGQIPTASIAEGEEDEDHHNGATNAEREVIGAPESNASNTVQPSSASSATTQPVVVVVVQPPPSQTSDLEPLTHLPPLASSHPPPPHSSSIVDVHSLTRSRSNPDPSLIRGGSPVRSSPALDKAAEKLFESMATIVKRRHSMLEAARPNGTLTITDRAVTLQHKQSLSQPHTPTLASYRPHPLTLHTDTLFLPTPRTTTTMGGPNNFATPTSTDSNSQQQPPAPLSSTPTSRRVSVSELAHQMLVGPNTLVPTHSPNPSDASELDHPTIMSDTNLLLSNNTDDLLSPVSPDSRARVEEVNRERQQRIATRTPTPTSDNTLKVTQPNRE